MSSRDTSKAELFGDIVVCIRKHEENLKLGMVLNRLRSSLRDFGEGDYILYAGGEWSSVLAAGVVLREMNVKHVDVLVWRKLEDKTGAYVPNRMVL